jgi:hypothetical protein
MAGSLLVSLAGVAWLLQSGPWSSASLVACLEALFGGCNLDGPMENLNLVGHQSFWSVSDLLVYCTQIICLYEELLAVMKS